jgi:hypothetical protein
MLAIQCIVTATGILELQGRYQVDGHRGKHPCWVESKWLMNIVRSWFMKVAAEIHGQTGRGQWAVKAQGPTKVMTPFAARENCRCDSCLVSVD